MSNILITSAGRRVSLVKYFKKELNFLFGNTSKVFTTDLHPELSTACYVSDKGFKIGKFQDPNYIPDLLNICRNNDINLIIPTLDPELLLLAKNIKLFENYGVQIVISDSEFIKICRDKRLTNELFVSKEFKIPSPIDRHRPKFPLFIKPISGSSSKNIYIIENESMLSEYHVANNDFMFMEYLDQSEHTEYTIDLYFGKDFKLKCVVPRIRIAVRGGEVNKGITQKNQLVTFCKEKLESLPGARGCLTLQIFQNKLTNEVFGIEINPRFGGGFPLSYLSGANYPEWILREYLLNEEIKWYNDWEDNLLLLRHDNEVVIHDFEYNTK